MELGRPVKEDLQTCASKHSGWRVSHTVLVQQCDKHQLLLFILLAVIKPFQYCLCSLDSALMCYNFYLIDYSFLSFFLDNVEFAHKMWRLIISILPFFTNYEYIIVLAVIWNIWLWIFYFFCIRLEDACFENWKHQKCQVVASKLSNWVWSSSRALLPGLLYGRHSGDLHYRKCIIS